jgi:hypothetical protein
MSDLSGWEVVKESQPKQAKVSTGDLSDWTVEGKEPEEDESVLKSLAYAPFRIGKDLAVGGVHALQKIPELYQQAKTEVPGLLDIAKNHKAHAAMQALAGSQEAINSLNHIPVGLAQYANKRLHLLPKAVPEFLNKVTPDTTEAINQLFDKPQFEGEKLIRGAVRNIPALVPAGKALASLGKLRPKNFLRGNLSPEDLKNNLRITQGTETGLGDVIGNPMLKRFNENILSKIPFSGVNEAMQKNAGEIINRGHSLIDQLAGKSDIGNLDKYLNDALKESYKSHQGEKNAHYKGVNKLADEAGLDLDLPNFADKVKQHKNAIEDTAILKYEPEMQNLLRKLGGYENPSKTEITPSTMVNVATGKPLPDEVNVTPAKKPKFEEVNLLKGKLNQLSRQHGASSAPSDRHLAGVFGDLARTLKEDIEGAIEKSGHEPLKNAYKAAEENYAKKFSPFLDKQIYKFLGGNADPETLIQSFVKTGKSSDRANLIKKVTDKLPAEDRNLLGYGYLQRAMDENNVLNPLKLKTLLSKNSLGNKQFEALFPNPVLRNALRDYVNLVDMNTKGLKLMQNPETGQMNMDILPLLSKSPASLGAKMLGAPIVAKKLRSEKTRTKLVKKMVKTPIKSKNSLHPLELTLIGGRRPSDEKQ